MPNQGNSNNMNRHGSAQKEPVLQGDFRKVSGISSEIFRQIEAIENDHDPSTAAALDVSFIIANNKTDCGINIFE